MAHTILDSYTNIVRKGLMPIEEVPDAYREEVRARLEEEHHE